MAIKRLDEAAKLQLVEWCSNGQNYEEIAKKLGVTGKVVRDWIIKLAPELISMRAHNNQDKINTVIKLYNEGGTYQNIANTVGVSKSTVIKWIKTHASDKLQENKNKFSQDVKDSAIELMRTHLNYTKVGEMLNLHPTTIRDWVLNIEPCLAILAKHKNPLLDKSDKILKQFDDGVPVSVIAKCVSIGEKAIRKLLNVERPKSALIGVAINLCEQGLNYEQVAKKIGKTGKTIGDWVRIYAPDLAQERSILNKDKELCILELYNKGLKYEYISESTGIALHLIEKRIKREHVTQQAIKDNTDIVKAIELCREGMTYTAVGKALNRKANTIRDWIMKNQPELLKDNGYKIASSEIKQKAVDLFLNGVNLNVIEHDIGFPIYVIKRWISKTHPNLLPKQRIAIPEKDISKVTSMLLSKEHTYKEIGEVMNCSGNAIRHFAIKNKLTHTRSEISTYLSSVGKTRIGGTRCKMSTQYGIIPCDSTYEIAKLLELTLDRNVINIERCHSIPITSHNNYVPDFKITYTNGVVKVIEIKAYWKTFAPDVVTKKAMAIAYFTPLGIGYELINERQIDKKYFDMARELLQSYDSIFILQNNDDRAKLIKSLKVAASMSCKVEGLPYYPSQEMIDNYEVTISTPRAPVKRLKITNGIDNRVVLTEADIPTGWHKGVTRTDAGTSMNITDGVQTKRIKKMSIFLTAGGKADIIQAVLMQIAFGLLTA